MSLKAMQNTVFLTLSQMSEVNLLGFRKLSWQALSDVIYQLLGHAELSWLSSQVEKQTAIIEREIPQHVRAAPNAKMFLRSYWYRACSTCHLNCEEMHLYTVARWDWLITSSGVHKKSLDIAQLFSACASMVVALTTCWPQTESISHWQVLRNFKRFLNRFCMYAALHHQSLFIAFICHSLARRWPSCLLQHRGTCMSKPFNRNSACLSSQQSLFSVHQAFQAMQLIHLPFYHNAIQTPFPNFCNPHMCRRFLVNLNICFWIQFEWFEHNGPERSTCRWLGWQWCFVCSFYLQLGLLQLECSAFTASCMAASALSNALEMFGKPAWSLALQHYSAYTQQDLYACKQVQKETQRTVAADHLRTIWRGYHEGHGYEHYQSEWDRAIWLISCAGRVP